MHGPINLRTINILPHIMEILYIFHVARDPSSPGPLHYRGFAITLGHNTIGRTPPDEWPVWRTDLYLTINNTHERPSCPWRNSDPKSQQASDNKPTPLTALSLGPEWNCNTECYIPRELLNTACEYMKTTSINTNTHTCIYIYIHTIIFHAMFSSNKTLFCVSVYEMKPFCCHKCECICMIYIYIYIYI